MVARRHRRQVLLFLVAILLPCVVLVALGLRIVSQERELAEKRLADERHSLTAQLRQELTSRLDRIAFQEATAFLADSTSPPSRSYRNPAVALVASVSDGRLVLPWDRDPRSARFRQLLAQGTFARLVSQGERAELGSGNPGTAIGSYTEALSATTDPAQGTYARLLRARASWEAGQRNEAHRDYRAVLTSSLDLVDEHGVPLAMYAASRLVEDDGDREAVVGQVRAALREDRWLSPSALYLLRDLVTTLGSTADSARDEAVFSLADTVAARLAFSEQALALQRDFPRLGLGIGRGSLRNGDAPWIALGSPPWLVGLATPVESEADVAVTVRSDALFASAQDLIEGETGTIVELAVAAADSGGGVPLGATFPGVVARFPSADRSTSAAWDARRWFYLVTLLFVLSVTLFGAYVVSRDIRRELRLADLRSRFVSAVSHELKTPLTAIRMFAETLQLGGSSDPETTSDYLETIVHESERLTRLLNNVLDFSKIERNQKEYRRAPGDLGEIVTASARAIQYPLEQQHFTLNVEVESGLPPASVDADAVEQAVLNLLANAVKYSGESREIDLRLIRSDGQAVIEVSDRGVGIAPEEQRRIFEQFYRVPSPDNEGVPGTGLGLTLAQHIAEGHGGRVTVKSQPGQGSTFAIHLPLGDEEP